MAVSGISSAGSSVGISVQITRQAQLQMVKDGQAAISLIRANEATVARKPQPAQGGSSLGSGSPDSGSKLDVKA